ncbi:hypothetical protein CEQ31_014015 [Serratia odorifera]|nr:hypothetical protein CEQ31_014015 [Serratia odorifera]RII71803.1 hypothetical protein DX901_12330 [Serratia odorifera]
MIMCSFFFTLRGICFSLPPSVSELMQGIGHVASEIFTVDVRMVIALKQYVKLIIDEFKNQMPQSSMENGERKNDARRLLAQ